ncbi:hypothetical protein HN011_004592 [Eciton burchellii]|nr:hypothetical protein HN011_004592 [Eciton burchellii]
MADDLYDFLKKQNTTIQAIKPTIPNYKKLSNITLARMRSRLSGLQKLWEKTHRLHSKISCSATTEETNKLSYFIQDEFLAAKDVYNEASDYLQETINSFVISGSVCDPSVDSAFFDFAGALDTVPDVSRSLEDAYNEATDHLQEAIRSFVKPENPVCDPSTDSAICDFADMLDTVTDNLRERGCSFVYNASVQNCVNCAGSHSLAKCEKFLSLAVEQRNTLARKKHFCFNCLQPGYFTPKCLSKSRCVHCRCTHHSLLHPEEGKIAKTIANQAHDSGTAVLSSSSVAEGAIVAHVQSVQAKFPHAECEALSAAWVDLHRAESRRVLVSALITQGHHSTLCFISESLSQMLRVKRQRADVSRSGVDEIKRGGARARVSLGLSSCNKFVPVISLTAYVLSNITVFQVFPSITVLEYYMASQIQPFERWSHLCDLELADPKAARQHPIHLLSGSNLFALIFVREFPYLGPTDVSNASDVLLAIAWVNLHAAKGRRVELRVLLDQESTLSFISKLFCQTLQTIRQCDDLQIHRFEKNYTDHAKSKVVFGLTPWNKSKPMFSSTVYVVDISSCTVFEAHVSHYVSVCNADSLLRKSSADEKISAKITKPTVHVDCASDWRLLHQYPNWPRLVKRTVYSRRFIENSKRKKNVPFEKQLSIPKASSLRT